MHTPDDTLVAVLDELVVLSDPAVHPRVVALLERLGAGDLRVALVGEAKRGKSTLGNARSERVTAVAESSVWWIVNLVEDGWPC